MLGDTFPTFVAHIHFTAMLSPSSLSFATLTLTFFAVIFDVREFALQYVKVHDGDKTCTMMTITTTTNDNISQRFHTLIRLEHTGTHYSICVLFIQCCQALLLC